MVDNLNSKLQGYKGKIMSFTSRAELINSVLESSVTYSMAVYKWPESTIKECTSKMRNVLWSGNLGKKKIGHCQLKES